MEALLKDLIDSNESLLDKRFKKIRFSLKIFIIYMVIVVLKCHSKAFSYHCI